MPQSVAEVGSGAQFSRSSEQNQVADTLTRTFRIILSSPQEYLDIQRACGVFIGQVHPSGVELTCVSFDARYEGESRMVVLATFNYQTNPGPQDNKRDPPPTRGANWSTSTTLAEVPKRMWRRRTGFTSWESRDYAAINPAGDMYDGVTALEPVVSINIEQWEVTDPTRHLMHAGSVNLEEITLGTLTMRPGTVMFRGVASQPAVESWGESTFRGWRCDYEFAYRRNPTLVTLGGTALQEVDIGWDIAVPLSGFNCRAFPPNEAGADDDIFGQPLRHFGGKIVPPLLLPDQITSGERVPAMVKICDYEDGGTAQARSASPIALKANGRPLKTHDANGNLINDPIVYAYRVQPAINITNTLQLRLY